VLALAEIEERHDSGFLVLWWVAFEDFFYEPLILGGEFEGNGEIIVVRITVLKGTQ
jgi:hypothetical protein